MARHRSAQDLDSAGWSLFREPSRFLSRRNQSEIPAYINASCERYELTVTMSPHKFRSAKVGFMAYNALAGGMLTGASVQSVTLVF